MAMAAASVVLLLHVQLAGAPPQSGAAAAAPIDDMVADVDGRNLVASVAALESFGTRYASTASCEAAGTQIGAWFRTFGLATEFEYFRFGTTPPVTTSNVIATLPGRVDPSRIVIVSAHYDSTSNEAQSRAPGADDNASGVAVVLELARIMRKRDFDFTVKFIAWGAEERGLIGSRYHAQGARQRQDQILAGIVTDMVGYANATPEDLDLATDSRSEWLARRYAAAAAEYGGLRSVSHLRSQYGSDCMAFWEQGYSAACAIEDDPLTNPNYHRVTDTVATINVEFLTATARATLALVAQLAQPVSTVRPPTGLRVVTQTSTSLFRRLRSAVLTWEPSDDAVTGYHVYRASSSHGEYRRLTASPIAGTSYGNYFLDANTTSYYVVTAVDRSGRESNYSGEASDEITR